MGGAEGLGTTTIVVVDGERRVAAWTLDVPERPGLELVELLALVELAMRRRGWSLRLADPCPRLLELVVLAGLAPRLCGAADLAVEAGREAEGGEELGVQEVVEPRDPPV